MQAPANVFVLSGVLDTEHAVRLQELLATAAPGLAAEYRRREDAVAPRQAVHPEAVSGSLSGRRALDTAAESPD